MLAASDALVQHGTARFEPTDPSGQQGVRRIDHHELTVLAASDALEQHGTARVVQRRTRQGSKVYAGLITTS